MIAAHSGVIGLVDVKRIRESFGNAAGSSRDGRGNSCASQGSKIGDFSDPRCSRKAGRWLGQTRTKTGFVLRFRLRLDRPDQFLGPIAVSVCDLLCDRDWSRRKRCANPACGLYFFDSTRNRRGRSCSIETCRNRIEVAAYRARQRAARSSPIRSPGTRSNPH